MDINQLVSDIGLAAGKLADDYGLDVDTAFQHITNIYKNDYGIDVSQYKDTIPKIKENISNRLAGYQKVKQNVEQKAKEQGVTDYLNQGFLSSAGENVANLGKGALQFGASVGKGASDVLNSLTTLLMQAAGGTEAQRYGSPTQQLIEKKRKAFDSWSKYWGEKGIKTPEEQGKPAPDDLTSKISSYSQKIGRGMAEFLPELMGMQLTGANLPTWSAAKAIPEQVASLANKKNPTQQDYAKAVIESIKAPMQGLILERFGHLGSEMAGRIGNMFMFVAGSQGGQFLSNGIDNITSGWTGEEKKNLLANMFEPSSIGQDIALSIVMGQNKEAARMAKQFREMQKAEIKVKQEQSATQKKYEKAGANITQEQPVPQQMKTEEVPFVKSIVEPEPTVVPETPKPEVAIPKTKPTKITEKERISTQQELKKFAKDNLVSPDGTEGLYIQTGGEGILKEIAKTGDAFGGESESGSNYVYAYNSADKEPIRYRGGEGEKPVMVIFPKGTAGVKNTESGGGYILTPGTYDPQNLKFKIGNDPKVYSMAEVQEMYSGKKSEAPPAEANVWNEISAKSGIKHKIGKQEIDFDLVKANPDGKPTVVLDITRVGDIVPEKAIKITLPYNGESQAILEQKAKVLINKQKKSILERAIEAQPQGEAEITPPQEVSFNIDKMMNDYLKQPKYQQESPGDLASQLAKATSMNKDFARKLIDAYNNGMSKKEFVERLGGDQLSSERKVYFEKIYDAMEKHLGKAEPKKYNEKSTVDVILKDANADNIGTVLKDISNKIFGKDVITTVESIRTPEGGRAWGLYNPNNREIRISEERLLDIQSKFRYKSVLETVKHEIFHKAVGDYLKSPGEHNWLYSQVEDYAKGKKGAAVEETLAQMYAKNEATGDLKTAFDLIADGDFTKASEFIKKIAGSPGEQKLESNQRLSNQRDLFGNRIPYEPLTHKQKSQLYDSAVNAYGKDKLYDKLIKKEDIPELYVNGESNEPVTKEAMDRLIDHYIKQDTAEGYDRANKLLEMKVPATTKAGQIVESERGDRIIDLKDLSSDDKIIESVNKMIENGFNEYPEIAIKNLRKKIIEFRAGFVSGREGFKNMGIDSFYKFLVDGLRESQGTGDKKLKEKQIDLAMDTLDHIKNQKALFNSFFEELTKTGKINVSPIMERFLNLAYNSAGYRKFLGDTIETATAIPEFRKLANDITKWSERYKQASERYEKLKAEKDFSGENAPKTIAEISVDDSYKRATMVAARYKALIQDKLHDLSMRLAGIQQLKSFHSLSLLSAIKTQANNFFGNISKMLSDQIPRALRVHDLTKRYVVKKILGADVDSNFRGSGKEFLDTFNMVRKSYGSGAGSMYKEYISMLYDVAPKDVDMFDKIGSGYYGKAYKNEFLNKYSGLVGKWLAIDKPFWHKYFIRELGEIARDAEKGKLNITPEQMVEFAMEKASIGVFSQSSALAKALEWVQKAGNLIGKTDKWTKARFGLGDTTVKFPRVFANIVRAIAKVNIWTQAPIATGKILKNLYDLHKLNQKGGGGLDFRKYEIARNITSEIAETTSAAVIAAIGLGLYASGDMTEDLEEEVAAGRISRQYANELKRLGYTENGINISSLLRGKKGIRDGDTVISLSQFNPISSGLIAGKHLWKLLNPSKYKSAQDQSGAIKYLMAYGDLLSGVSDTWLDSPIARGLKTLITEKSFGKMASASAATTVGQFVPMILGSFRNIIDPKDRNVRSYGDPVMELLAPILNKTPFASMLLPEDRTTLNNVAARRGYLRDLQEGDVAGVTMKMLNNFFLTSNKISMNDNERKLLRYYLKSGDSRIMGKNTDAKISKNELSLKYADPSLKGMSINISGADTKEIYRIYREKFAEGANKVLLLPEEDSPFGVLKVLNRYSDDVWGYAIRIFLKNKLDTDKEWINTHKIVKEQLPVDMISEGD